MEVTLSLETVTGASPVDFEGGNPSPKSVKAVCIYTLLLAH